MKPIDIAEELMFTTVRLKADNGCCGTGYFFEFDIDGRKVSVIVTNKHVVNNSNNEIISFQVHLTNDGVSTDGNFTIRLDSHWIFHPTKDLCLTFCDKLFDAVKQFTKKEVFCNKLNQSLIYETDQLKKLSMMESIVMVGYPNGLWDQQNNFPLFRYGYTASHPGFDFNESGIGVIDAACFPGSSGSPIFILNKGMSVEKNGDVVIGGRPLIFLGTLFAGPQYNAEGQIVIKSIADVPVAETKLMLNLGLYIKAYELKEFESILRNYNL